ncbi:hypothetical protein [Marinitoga sp. 38H-ov]|uniref:hypothetical protein n=1 Tax=Marinitoga sp. 38H-ov TaxID=1755814 RepID=UPI0013EE02C4|nr:hypothetical protein [Marinitoga sp. 38H-ov]
MKKNKKALSRIFKKYDNPEFYLIIDENIVYLSAEFLISNGWLGEETINQLKDVLLNNLTIMREKWIKFSRELYPNIQIKKINGNYKEIIEKIIEEKNIDELIITFKKDFNPYWNILKYIFENISKKYKVKITIIN